MEILIISGLSGSGKSRTAAFLEDIGYYIVDNLPAEMMLKFANFCTASGGRYDRVALVYDVRAGGRSSGSSTCRTSCGGGTTCGAGCCF